MKKIEEPFSIVARNPEIEIIKEKLTLKNILKRGLISIFVAFVLSLPLTLIVLFRFMANPDKDLNILVAFANIYIGLYLFIFGVSFFAIFIIVPSLRKWHWTKHQF